MSGYNKDRQGRFVRLTGSFLGWLGVWSECYNDSGTVGHMFVFVLPRWIFNEDNSELWWPFTHWARLNCLNGLMSTIGKILDRSGKICIVWHYMTWISRFLGQNTPISMSSSYYNLWTRNKFRHLFCRDHSILNRRCFPHSMAGSFIVESTSTCHHCGITFVFEIEDVLVYWILFHCPDIIGWRR